MAEALKFAWDRMYKTEEYLEREAYSSAEEYVVDFYEVEDIGVLTKEQIDDMMSWREENVSEYSPMYAAFQDVYNVWENEQED